MKKNILFTFLLCAIVGLGYAEAQSKGGKNKGEHKEHKAAQNLTPEQRAKKNSERLGNKLSLTADQKAKVYDFSLTRIKKSDEARATEAKDKKGKGEALKAARSEFDTNLNSILTPEQKVKWDELKTQAKARKQDRKRDGSKAVKPTTENVEDLDLED